MLDDVERRAFLVQPTREYADPVAVRALDVELDERAGERVVVPRRTGLARAKPHHRVLDPDRLARLESQVADDPVALVEKAEDGHPLGHWGDARKVAVGRARNVDRDRGFRRRRLVLGIASRKRDDSRQGESSAHAYSGFHA
jgi:hypothetical protein